MSTNKDLSAEIIIKIPFHDIDLAEVAWHGHYVKYFEIARCELLEKFDYNYPQMKASGFFWPIIDIHLRYTHPARFLQLINVKASIVEWENRLKITYLITDLETHKRLTKGHTIQVAVDMKNEEMLLASPDILYHKLGISNP
jgi:acyl-CoA thioester hydrolase